MGWGGVNIRPKLKTQYRGFQRAKSKKPEKPTNNHKGDMTMFYLKHKGKKLFIEDDNVFTQCPACGKELPINLADAVVDGNLQLYGMAFYCEKCGKKLRESAGSREG